MSDYVPDGLAWKPDIPQDKPGARVCFFEREDRYFEEAGEVTFIVAGGSGRWFVWRSHFGSSDQPHRTKYFPNRRTATQCFEHVAYQ